MSRHFIKSRLTAKCGRLVSRHLREFIQLNLLAIIVSIFAGCSTPSAVPSTIILNNPNGNVHLYVSDQSFAISPVDIKVFIDGDLVVNEKFEVGSQHSWQTFMLKLSPGRHKVFAESSNGHAKLEQTFEVNDKSWAALAYSFYPKPEGGVEPRPGHFSFVVNEEPMYFQ